MRETIKDKGRLEHILSYAPLEIYNVKTYLYYLTTQKDN